MAAGLVPHAHEWPGAKVRVGEIGLGVLCAARPAAYFDPKNPQWPEEATLSLALPPTIDHDRAEDFRHAIAAELERQELQAQAEVKKQGRRFLGAEQAGKVSPHERVTSLEAPRSGNPTFAVGHKQGDAWRVARAAVRGFRALYRAALEQWRAGVRSVVFPAGTWWMCTFHGANMADVVLRV